MGEMQGRGEIMNYTWIEATQTGKPETGKLIIFDSREAGTQLALHYRASFDKQIRWISARFYIDHDPDSAFMHWIAEDVKELLIEREGCIFPKEFTMQAEYYKENEELPYSLGDYTL